MSETILTQDEANNLIAMDKVCEDKNHIWEFPDLGGNINIPMESKDKKEKFILDVGRGRINFKKVSYQNRARQIIVLVRLDYEGSPHRNPDNTEIKCPHLHIYREGYNHKWAFPLPPESFSNTSDIFILLEEFMDYCNMTERPNIQRGLFT